MPGQTAHVGNALVTGASSGIGRETARLLAGSGFRVFGTSRHDRTGDQVLGPGVHMLTMDVRSVESVDACVEQVLRRAGRIDLLVNNAGVMHEGFAEETTIEQAEAVFATNLFGVVRVTNAVLPDMRSRGRGRIVNIGSLAAWIGEPGEGFYAASKAALARYTEALRHEVWSLGISVSLVEPGAFATNVLNAASTSGRTVADYDGLRESARDTLHESLATGADPARVARLVRTIAGARAPRFRYGAGRDGHLVPYLRALLPQRLFDHLLRRSFGLPTSRRG